MKRRDVVKRIGATGLLVGVSAGAAGADSTGRVPPRDLTDEELAELAADDDYPCIVEPCGGCPPACDVCIC